jgi:His-Xaa-Ser system protein HxsD
LSFADSNTYRVSVKPTSTTQLSSDELENLLLKVERDLVDFNLRDIVTKETQNVRDLLIAKAFSNGEFDELPPGDVSDPVGFNPTEL